ncbi:MAG: prepilin-type N-terminal cleavage/methylation domain-containing protein [Syntrophales bacterium]
MCSNTKHCIRRKNRCSKGYTLIEVLVAMAIFTAMLMLAGMALDQGLRQYHGLVEKGLGFWDYAKKIWIDKSLNSSIDYYVYTRDDGWFPYFKGSQSDISYISLAPFAGDVPVVAWLAKESEADGKRSLVYYEIPVYTKSYEEIDRDYIFGDYKKGKSLKLLEGMKSIEFNFYGYDILSRKYGWYSSFEGNRMKVLPSLVKISYNRDEGAGSLIFNINVNSLAKTTYNEVYSR